MSTPDDPVFREPAGDGLESIPELGLGDLQFRDALAMLLDRVDSLPPEERRRLQDVAETTRESHEKLRQTVQRLQATLDTLRLSIKYLVFDVEATRRENENLKKMMGQGPDE